MKQGIDKVIFETSNNKGISFVYDQWCAFEGTKSEDHRIDFYLDHLHSHLDELFQKTNIYLKECTVVISGMASSSIGIKELPYAKLPFSLNGDNAIIYCIPPSDKFNCPVILLSGISGNDEVMRGEETQLVGIANLTSSFCCKDTVMVMPFQTANIPTMAFLADNKQLFSGENTIVVMPGTHSKHIHVRNGEAIEIESYLTGELFALVSKNSLLKEAVTAPECNLNEDDWRVFIDGVDYSGTTPLLQGLFKIRTNYLFKRLTKQQNYIYLSGLLIGYELRGLLTKTFTQIVLCSEIGLFEYYKRTIEHLEFNDSIIFISPKEAEAATIRGQKIISERYLNLKHNA